MAELRLRRRKLRVTFSWIYPDDPACGVLTVDVLCVEDPATGVYRLAFGDDLNIAALQGVSDGRVLLALDVVTAR